MTLTLSKITTPEDFLKIIPSDLKENIKFRMELHSVLADDKEAQKDYMEMCDIKPQIAFNTALWTYDPRKPPGYQNNPFILRPKQSIMVDGIKDAIDNEHNLLIDKSRDEGATEVICKMFALYWWLRPDVYFLVSSRKEDFVDKSVNYKNGVLIGLHKSLFHKIMYGIVNLPAWVQVDFLKTHCSLQNLNNNSMIGGESTNESMGAGDRATAVLVDEVARIEPDVAQYIIDNIQDVSPCCIYNSTHFRWGSGHPYARLLRSNRVTTITLGFEDNPEKNAGLYWSPLEDIIEIKDINYYRRICPEVFNDINKHQSFSYSEFQKKIKDLPDEVYEKCKDINFVADGGETNFKRDRSIWYDEQEARGRSKTDLAQNVLRIPQGSADMFFDEATIHKLRSIYECEPTYIGDIKYTNNNNIITKPYFTQSGINHHLKWWGKMIMIPQEDGTAKGFADTKHNYIVACDISRGTGASNSVISICDVNRSELIGLYVNPFIDVTDLAELAVAICKWLGDAYLIWEANGPGDTFDKRITKLGYHRVYINVNERRITRRRSQNRGWRSTPGVNGSKMDMLSHFNAALTESIKSEKLYRYIIIHDGALINELEDYIFMPGRIDVDLSNSITDESGARYAHGDRVIATGLCILAMNEMKPADLKKYKNPPTNSFEYRFRKWKEEQDKEKRELRVYRY